MVFGLIEDADGVANIDEIVGTGIDGVLFGPFDLSTEMGLEGDVSNATVREMNDRVRKAALSAGIQYLALPGLDGTVASLLAEGVRLFNLSGDRGLLFTAFQTALAEAKGASA
jgi:2-keto-3-deoxy-L-rhamnonate aldolase RhmA